MKRTLVIFGVVASSTLAVTGVAYAFQPRLVSQALKHLALGTFGEGTACVGDNQCTSGHCRLVMPDAGPGSAAECCSMGGESCGIGGNVCCAESELACNSNVCCQTTSGVFCERDADCCLPVPSKPAATAVNQCMGNSCEWCIPTGNSAVVGTNCCVGAPIGGMCCAPPGAACRTYSDGGSDACPGLVCTAAGTAALSDGIKCTSSTQCASGQCVDAGTTDAGCGGPC